MPSAHGSSRGQRRARDVSAGMWGRSQQGIRPRHNSPPQCGKFSLGERGFYFLCNCPFLLFVSTRLDTTGDASLFGEADRIWVLIIAFRASRTNHVKGDTPQYRCVAAIPPFFFQRYLHVSCATPLCSLVLAFSRILFSDIVFGHWYSASCQTSCPSPLSNRLWPKRAVMNS